MYLSIIFIQHDSMYKCMQCVSFISTEGSRRVMIGKLGLWFSVYFVDVLR